MYQPRPRRFLLLDIDGGGHMELGRVSQALRDQAVLAHNATPSRWPEWAELQLLDALDTVHRVQDRGERRHLAGALYRDWFSPPVGRVGEVIRGGRPLAGTYRSAHAGTVAQQGEIDVLRRHDVVGRDGWWRTWGESWTPPRSRPGSVRLLITPQPSELAAVVRIITTALLDVAQPWLLACATDPRRLRRTGGVVLDLGDPGTLPAQTVVELTPLLRPSAPPLCLPIAPGIALAEFPDNGMTFGEHRCHLIALAVRHPSAYGAPLRAIASVFAAHGIDPGAPYRSR